MKFELQKSKILRNLFIVVGVLLIGNILTIYLRINTLGVDAKFSRLIIKLLDFNTEANLPTFFSSLILLCNGILLAFIGVCRKAHQKKFWHWYGLAFIFCFLSLDEMIQIHEQLRYPMAKLFNTSGLLYFAWFIPYGIATIILAIAYMKFLMQLPKQVLKLFVLSGILYVSGAIGMEAIGGMHAEVNGVNNLTYYLIYTIEELLELIGSIVFFYVLLHYLSIDFKNFNLRFKVKKIKSKNLITAV